MSKKAPNKVLAPIVIAGITIGFLASAYKFIFAAKQRTEIEHEDSIIEKNDHESEK